MFARHFDPEEWGKEKAKPQIPFKKRKLSETSIADENEESVHESSASSSESSSSESDSDSDSESDSSESESDAKEENEDVADFEEKPNLDVSQHVDQIDKMEVDELEDKDFKTGDDTMNTLEQDSEYLKKHASVFKKFQSAQNQDVDMDNDTADKEEEVETKDLAPLPQPELPKDATLRSLEFHTKSLDWLAKPMYVSPEETSPFDAFDISPTVMKNVEEMNFKSAFSVQVAVFRMLLEDIKKNRLRPDFRGDILVNASTGSGKTLAYCVPIIEALHKRIVPRVRAVILVPTRPLTQQVTQTLMELSKRTKLRIVSLSSDMSISDEGHKISTNVPDIIVSTPGRLVEHLINDSISFEALRFLVVDEADRLLNQSFQNWSEIVVSSIEKTRSPTRNVGNAWSLQPQKLVFSATLTTDAGKLSSLKFKKPRLIVVNSKRELVNEMFSVPATLTESKILFASSESAYKPLLLAKLMIQAKKLTNVLIFSRSNDSTLRLAKVLEGLFKKLHPSSPINVAYMNSTNNLSSVRNRVFRDFSSGDINVLVATDLIARGLDLLSITDVINYDLPVSSREYVHRVGRTARANQKGDALSLVFGKGENQWFESLMTDVGRSQPVEELYPKAIDLYVDDHEKQKLEDVLKRLTE